MSFSFFRIHSIFGFFKGAGSLNVNFWKIYVSINGKSLQLKNQNFSMSCSISFC